ERVREPLADRGIDVGHVQAKERTLRVSEGETGEGVPPDPDEFAGFDVGLVYPTRLMEGAVVGERLGVPWVNGRDAVVTSR
ncbi:RimK family alpha-L-glutamate ligase, partial [Halorubrum sp. SS5]